MPYFKIVKGLESHLDDGFEYLGTRVARYPGRTIAIAVVMCVICFGGFAFFTFESDGSVLYAPPDSRARDIKSFVDARYGFSDRLQMMAVAPPGQSMLTTARLTQLRALYSQIYTWPTFQALCSRLAPDLPCDATSIVSVFGGPTLDSFDVLLSLSEEDRLAALVSAESSLGGPPALGGVVGGVTRDPNTQQLLGVRALSLAFNIEAAHGADGREKPEKDFIDMGLPGPFDFSVARFTESSIGFEVERSVQGDIVLVAVGITLMIGFTVFSLGKFDIVKSRGLLALASVANVLLSMGAGFGFCMYLQIEYITLCNLLPFLLLGIGVDDAFILVSAVNEARLQEASTGKRQSVVSRISKALRTGGVTITATSLTDLLAFALGSISSIPAIRIFCSYAAACIAADWLLQITFFVACLTFDERRIDANRWDWLPCVRGADPEVTNVHGESDGDDDHHHHQGEGVVMAAIPGPMTGVSSKSSKSAAPLATSSTTSSASSASSSVSSSDSDDDDDDDDEQQESVYSSSYSAGSSRSSSNPGPNYTSVSAKKVGHDDESYTMITAVSGSGGDERGRQQQHQEEEHRSRLDAFIAKVYAPFLLSPLVAAAVVVIFLGFAGFAIFASTQVSEGLDLRILVPDDSYVVDYLDIRDAMFRETFRMFFYATQPQNWHDPAVWLRLRALHNNLLASRWILSDYGSWFITFEQWVQTQPAYSGSLDPEAGIPVPASAFYAAVAEYTAAPPGSSLSQASLASNVIMNEARDGIVSFRFAMAAQQLFDTDGEVDSMEDLRAIVDSAYLGIEVYHPRHIFTEQYLIVVPAVILNLIVAAVAVAVVMLVMVKHPLSAALVVLMVAFVDLGLFAAMYIADININSVSLINLVLAVGAGLDPSAHITHAYMALSGSRPRKDRAVFSLQHIGGSVMLGGLSSLIGLIPLALSSSTIFRVFFTMLFSTFVLANLHGVIFLPVVLRTFGPRGTFCCSPPIDDDDDDDAH